MARSLILSALAACAVGTCALGAPKAKFYTKTADAVKAAKAADRPILLYFAPKGSKVDQEFTDKVFKKKIFMDEVVGKNFVLLKIVPQIKMHGNLQTIMGLSPNDQNSVNLGFQGVDKMWGYGFAILDSDAQKALVRGGYGGMPQPKGELPLHNWFEVLNTLCQSKGVKYEVSPALQKYIANPPSEKKSKKKSR